MDLRWGTRTSFRTVMKPHMKNSVVTTVRATRWVAELSVATGPAELTLGIAISIVSSVDSPRRGPARRADVSEDNRLTRAGQALTFGLTMLPAVAQTGVPFG